MLKPKPLDYLAFAAVLAVIGLISVRVYAAGSGRKIVQINGTADEWLFPLDSNTTLAVHGPLGDTTIVIEGRTVRTLSSPCPEKICIKSGIISKPGQWIACLPNGVFVSIVRKNDRIDALSF